MSIQKLFLFKIWISLFEYQFNPALFICSTIVECVGMFPQTFWKFRASKIIGNAFISINTKRILSFFYYHNVLVSSQKRTFNKKILFAFNTKITEKYFNFINANKNIYRHGINIPLKKRETIRRCRFT